MDVVLVPTAGQSDIRLAMREHRPRQKDTNPVKRLSLTFVYGDAKCQAEWELTSREANGVLAVVRRCQV